MSEALPRVLAEIAAVAGEDAALAIAAKRGGTRVYIPPVPASDHWLSKLVGHDKAKAIADRLTAGVASIRVDIPLGPNGRMARGRAEVDRMIREGRSERDIALATGYTLRTVERRAARLRRGGQLRDDRQLPLL